MALRRLFGSIGALTDESLLPGKKLFKAWLVAYYRWCFDVRVYGRACATKSNPQGLTVFPRSRDMSWPANASAAIALKARSAVRVLLHQNCNIHRTRDYTCIQNVLHSQNFDMAAFTLHSAC